MSQIIPVAKLCFIRFERGDEKIILL